MHGCMLSHRPSSAPAWMLKRVTWRLTLLNSFYPFTAVLSPCAMMLNSIFAEYTFAYPHFVAQLLKEHFPIYFWWKKRKLNWTIFKVLLPIFFERWSYNELRSMAQPFPLAYFLTHGMRFSYSKSSVRCNLLPWACLYGMLITQTKWKGKCVLVCECI